MAQFQAVQQGFVAAPFTRCPPLTAAALDLTDVVRGRVKSLKNSLADRSAKISDLQRTVHLLQGELSEVVAQRKRLQGRVEKLEGELRKSQGAKSSTGETTDEAGKNALARHHEELRKKNFLAVEEARKERLKKRQAGQATEDTQGP